MINKILEQMHHQNYFFLKAREFPLQYSGLRIWCCLCSSTIPSPVWCNGLRIQPHHSCDMGCSCVWDSIPGLGSYDMCAAGKKKKREREQDLCSFNDVFLFLAEARVESKPSAVKFLSTQL